MLQLMTEFNWENLWRILMIRTFSRSVRTQWGQYLVLNFNLNYFLKWIKIQLKMEIVIASHEIVVVWKAVFIAICQSKSCRKYASRVIMVLSLVVWFHLRFAHFLLQARVFQVYFYVPAWENIHVHQFYYFTFVIQLS